MGERSLNPRPYKAKHNSNARVEHRRAKKKRASQRSAKERRKEGRKERKKGRTRSTSRSRAEYINFYEERLGFYVRREAGLKSPLDSPVAPKFAFFQTSLKRSGAKTTKLKRARYF